MEPIHIAIDGPAGAGKSTIASGLAKALQILHLDTGAMYRAVTHQALELGIDLNDPDAYGFIEDLEFTFKDKELYLNQVNVEKAIRNQTTTQNVSLVASHKSVRDALVQRQQAIAEDQSLVMDGRDIGTVVLPNARYKFFLTADPKTRALRRQKELLKKGESADLDFLIQDIIRRDDLDSNRRLNPLKKAPDAIEIDTATYSIIELINHLTQIVKEG
jgi:cytidylate kinase/small subunit ribosomal protein S1